MIDGEICLLNESFPPIIDGVANVVVNYSRVLTKDGYRVRAVVPAYPGADDSGFEFPVQRYASMDFRKSLGYTAGNPFDFPTIQQLKKQNIGILHAHSPVMSGFLARSIREHTDIPYVMTYHTRFDVDIANAIKVKFAQTAAIKTLVENISAADEVWAVSRGAGENLRRLGFEGDYVVMENGVDVPRQRRSETEIYEACKGCDLPQGVPVFLFVGRLMWYKGLRIILDALAALKSQDCDFRMVFIGGGGDEKEIKDYAETLRLMDKVIFTGPIRDRAVLSCWYCRADLFLFPSTFDTNGLVVREAAACGLASVLINGSCAAEGVTNGRNGLMTDENAASLAVCLTRYMNDLPALRKLGENASDELYISWDEAVRRAEERYEVVVENHRRGMYKTRRSLFTFTSGLLDLLAAAEEYARSMRSKIDHMMP